ncbi:type III pantothenate kinase [Gallaecimonas sp. GXIMD4217]|uniref:type III pantothenate kinase n=1 Tax=Gallaecimonas sp. GXIMD4217 TaxID=3131927 RepID=UPI00311B3B3E
MTALLAEVGNTYLKAALAGDDGWQYLGRFALGELAEQLADAVPADCQKLVFASVAQDAATHELESFALDQGLAYQRVVTESKAFGVTNAYQDCRRLGVDRWLALVAAHGRYQGPCLVVDIGTAVTLDLVASDGRHLGGWIAPGFQLMSQSVLAKTAQVRSLDDMDQSLAFGDDTGLCLAQGCRAMLHGIIDQGIALAKARLGEELQVVLTGGGSRHLARPLPWQLDERPELVLEGLAVYATR